MNIWTILGFSVAVVASFCITVAELLQDKSYYENYRSYACASLIVAGVGLWLLGALRKRARKQPKFDDNRPLSAALADEQESEPGRSIVLFSPFYWGPMSIVFGIVIIFIVPQFSTLQGKVQARESHVQPTNQVVVTNSAPKTNGAKPLPPKPVKFPEVKLQGVILHVSKPCVIISGKAFFVGDYIQDAVIVSITRSTLTLELAGQQKQLPIER